MSDKETFKSHLDKMTKELVRRQKAYPKSSHIIIVSDTGLIQLATDWSEDEYTSPE